MENFCPKLEGFISRVKNHGKPIFEDFGALPLGTGSEFRSDDRLCWENYRVWRPDWLASKNSLGRDGYIS